MYLILEAAQRTAEGRAREALPVAEESLDMWLRLLQYHYFAEALVEAADAAFELDDLARVEALLGTADQLPLIQHRPVLDAQVVRLTAKLAARRDEPAADGFEAAANHFRELEMPFWVAVTRLEHAESLIRGGRAAEAEPLLAEAGGVFERLRAEPWSKRVELARAAERVEAARR
jgi:hypothetical protein